MAKELKLEWCPNHHLEDECYSNALEIKWKDMKARHEANCVRTDCEIDNDYHMIKHGQTGVHATATFWWRKKRYI